MKNKLALLVLASVLFSCSSGEKESDETVATDTVAVVEEDMNDAQKVFYALPSPFEVANILKGTGVELKKEVMNNPDNVSKYTTSVKQAMNIGVYGADLSVSIIYGQTQSTMFYLSSLKNLSDQLGIANAFDQNTMSRLDKTKGSQDSLETIVSNSYFIANAYLKDNERMNLSSMILAGGFLEGLYIAVNLMDEKNMNEELLFLIADQKYSLDNLIGLLTANRKEAGVEEVLQDYLQISAVYEKMAEPEVEAATTVETEKTEEGIAVIGGDESHGALTPELFKELKTKVSEIRNKYTS